MINNIEKDMERVGNRAYREKQCEMLADMKLPITENAIKTDGIQVKITAEFVLHRRTYFSW